MSILKKLFTAVRGGAREAGQAIVDANGIRILSNQIPFAKCRTGINTLMVMVIF